MHIGNYQAKVVEKNSLGGGMVKILEKPYQNTLVGFSKFDGFDKVLAGEVITVWFEHGYYKTVKFNMAVA